MLFFQLLLAFIAFLILPGFLFCRTLMLRSTIEHVPLYFGMSCLLFVIPGWLTYGFALTVRDTVLLFVFIVLALILSYRILDRKNAYLEQEEQEGDGWFNTAMFTTLTATVAVLLFWVGGYQDGDMFQHVAQIRQYTYGPVLSRSPYYHDSTAGTLYNYNIWHLSLAVLSWISRVDPLYVVIDIAALLFPISAIAVYLFLKEILHDKRAALFSASLWIVYHLLRVPNLWAFRAIPAPYDVAYFILYPVALYLYIRYLHSHRRAYLVFCVLTGILIATVHLFILVLFFMTIGFTTLGLYVLKRDSCTARDSLFSLAFLFLSVLPYILVQAVVIYHSGEKESVRMRIEDVILLNDWLYLLKPSFVIDIFTMVGLGGLVLSFAFSRNRTLAEIFAFSNIMLPVLLLLTPITVPVLARIIHLNLVFRIPHMMVIPNALLIGSLLSRGTASLQKSLSAKTAIFLSLLSLLMVSIFMVQTQTISMIKGVAKKLVQYRRYDEGFAIKGMYRYIRENLPDGSVIMSDPYLSYHIPAFARHFVVAPHNHPPYVKDRNERLYDTLYFFDPLTSTAEILPIIKKYHIGYILLNRSAIPEFPKKFLEASFFEKLHEDWIYPDLRQSSKDTPNAVFYKVKIGEKEMKETAERLSTLAMSYSLDGRPDKAWSLIKLVERLYPEKGHMLKIIEQKGKETFENLWREIGRGGQNISDLILRLCSLSMFDHEGRRHRLLVEMEREGLLRSFEMTIPGKESFPKVIKGIDYGATPPRIDTGLIWLHGSMNTLTFEFQGPVIINQLVLDVSISEKFYIIGGILRLGIDGEGYDVIGSFESIDSFDFGRHSIWLKDIDRTARFIRITIMGDSLSPIEVPRIYIKGYTF